MYGVSEIIYRGCGALLTEQNWRASDRRSGSKWCEVCHGRANTKNQRLWRNNRGVRRRPAKRRADWLKAHPGHHQRLEDAHGDARYLRVNRHLVRRYGITLGRAVKIAENQGWKCAICGTDLKLSRRNNSLRKRSFAIISWWAVTPNQEQSEGSYASPATAFSAGRKMIHKPL